jgi:hypothetical protein
MSSGWSRCIAWHGIGKEGMALGVVFNGIQEFLCRETGLDCFWL